MANFIGIDYGRKRMGLAFADELGVAVPLQAISGADFEDWQEQLDEILHTRKVDELVVGYPLNMDGSHGTRTKEVAAFVEVLEKRFGLPVHRSDERLTSHAVREDLKTIGKSMSDRESGELDSGAATIILRDFLEEQNPAPLPDFENLKGDDW